MKALLIETEYGNGFIVQGPLPDTIKVIESFRPVRISGDTVIIDDRKVKFSIVDVDEKEA